jgi:hypothetical protein
VLRVMISPPVDLAGADVIDHIGGAPTVAGLALRQLQHGTPFVHQGGDLNCQSTPLAPHA